MHYLLCREINSLVLKIYFAILKIVKVVSRLRFLRTPYMFLGRSLGDSLLLKDDKSSVKVADFNDPSMCVYAAILN